MHAIYSHLNKNLCTRCLHGVKFMLLMRLLSTRYETVSQTNGRPAGPAAAVDKSPKTKYHCSSVCTEEQPGEPLSAYIIDSAHIRMKEKQIHLYGVYICIFYRRNVSSPAPNLSERCPMTSPGTPFSSRMDSQMAAVMSPSEREDGDDTENASESRLACA